jgi:predicted porin
MWGWQAAAQVNILPDVFWVAAGYSEVGLGERNGYLSDNQYRRGNYVFANAFYNITPRLTLALEYLYGSRKDMNDISNSANRINIMAQYNF